MNKKRVIIAMSGGVDSAVAAGLLVREGYEVVGITMRLWTQEDTEGRRNQKRCCGVEDTDDVAVAHRSCRNDHVKFRNLVVATARHYLIVTVRGRSLLPGVTDKLPPTQSGSQASAVESART